MRKLILIVVFSYSTILFAQSPGLFIQGATPNLYLNHIVSPKEGLYSIARTFNLTPKVLASYNNLPIEKGLSVGQVIKIPLTEQNFEQQDQAQPDESFINLFHLVGKSETLFRIGNNHNKVSPENIKKWSKLSTDNIETGNALVVGHLKVKNDQLVFFNGAAATEPPNDVANSAIAKEPITRKPEGLRNAPINKNTPTTDIPIATKQTEVKVEQKIVVSDIPVNRSEAETRLAVASETPKATSEIRKVTGGSTGELQNKVQSLEILSTSDEGAFMSLYANKINKATEQASGQAGTFKTTSGWQDKKYYVLMNNVTPGTILKISSAENKSVYAKVLGAMPEMKENNGLLLRMSNSAASYLGIIDPKFPVQISY